MVIASQWNSKILLPAIASVSGLLALAGLSGMVISAATAQERLPWRQGSQSGATSGGYEQPYDSRATDYEQPYRQAQSAPDPYAARAPVDRYDYGQGRQGSGGYQQPPAYQAPRSRGAYAAPAYPQPAYPQPAYPQTAYPQSGPANQPPRHIQPYQQPERYPRYGASAPYQQPHYRDEYGSDERSGSSQYRGDGRLAMPHGGNGTYSENEVIDAGHRFFGTLSTGLAKAIQWTFKKSGRPNGYILGEDAGGAFVAGLRYGEGRLYTKHYGSRRVFWQGPSIGYDFGGDGNRTMTLVYNLRSPADVFRRFGGVQGAAYLVGGVGVQLLTANDITLAPIRTGVGLRLGANIGYLKYTRRPTWNPF